MPRTKEQNVKYMREYRKRRKIDYFRNKKLIEDFKRVSEHRLRMKKEHDALTLQLLKILNNPEISDKEARAQMKAIPISGELIEDINLKVVLAEVSS